MVSSFTLATLISVVSVAAATNSSSHFVNIVNPVWALPGGKNLTGQFGASVVGVDATATTYQVGCNGLISLTKICGWSTAPPQLITQGSTNEHFTWGNTDDEGESLTFRGDYTFSSTLAPIVTGTFYVSTVEVSFEEQTTTTNFVTSTFLETTTETSATWYAIPITAGLEKLSQATTTGAGAQSTATSSTASGSSSKTGTGAAVAATTSAAGGERVVGRAGMIAGVLGGVGILGGLL